MAAKKYNYFIGIDVSRNELDFAVNQDKKLLYHKEIENNTQAINNFILDLKKLPKFRMSKTIFCMEHTGIYCSHLLNTLQKKKANIVLENALKIKNSLGLIRGKNDKVDSIRIAQYSERNQDDLKFYVQKRPVIQQLSALSTLRYRMLSLQTALNMPIKEQQTFIAKEINKQTTASCRATSIAINLDIAGINNQIDKLINDDERLSALMLLITSVPLLEGLRPSK